MHRSLIPASLVLATVAGTAVALAPGALAQDPSAPAASAAVLPGEPNAPFDDGATAVTADPSLIDPRRIRWDAVLVAPDGRTLTVYFRSGDPGCTGLAGVETYPDEGGVAVELTVGDVAGAPSCPGGDQLFKTVVVVDQPVVTGARLFDLPSGIASGPGL